MTDSVYARVLGCEFDSLTPQLRQYFAGDASGRPGFGSGMFEVAGSSQRILLPILAWLGTRHVLFPDYGRDIPFDVVNTPQPDGGLTAVRSLHFPGRVRVLEDTMRVIDGRLHDFLGRRRGLEAQFDLSIVDGLLRMRSGRLWLHLGAARIRIPRLASVSVDESWREDASLGGRQHVDVRLRSPLVGEWFRYSGSFSYQYRAP